MKIKFSEKLAKHCCRKVAVFTLKGYVKKTREQSATFSTFRLKSPEWGVLHGMAQRLDPQEFDTQNPIESIWFSEWKKSYLSTWESGSILRRPDFVFPSWWNFSPSKWPVAINTQTIQSISILCWKACGVILPPELIPSPTWIQINSWFSARS